MSIETTTWQTYHIQNNFYSLKHIFVLMHQSIPAVPIPPPGQPWGICQCCQSRGWGIRNFIAARGLGISIPRGESRAFDTRVFELTWRSLSGRTKPLWKTGLSVTDLKNLWKFLKVCFIYIYIHFFLCTLVLGSTNIFYHISVKLSVSFLFT